VGKAPVTAVVQPVIKHERQGQGGRSGPHAGLCTAHVERLNSWQRAVRGRTFSSRRPHSQIDHVLVRGGIEVVDGEVLADTPSDHLPIRARLRLVQALT